MAALRELRLEAWSRGNAAALLGAFALAAMVKKPWPVAAAALLSFAVLLVHARGAWTPSGRFGAANLVTSVRLLLVCALAFFLHRAPGLLLAAAVLGIFLLDGVDGWLARRGGLASPFGAHFDMETDALLVLVINLELWQRGELGAWIMSAGLLRYAYVLCLALVPARGGEMPRSLLARAAFAVLVLGLILALVLPAPLSALSAALGTAAVVLSFARSFYWAYGRRADQAAAA